MRRKRLPSQTESFFSRVHTEFETIAHDKIGQCTHGYGYSPAFAASTMHQPQTPPPFPILPASYPSCAQRPQLSHRSSHQTMRPSPKLSPITNRLWTAQLQPLRQTPGRTRRHSHHRTRTRLRQRPCYCGCTCLFYARRP